MFPKGLAQAGPELPEQSTGVKVPPKSMLRALVEMVVTLVAVYLVREVLAILAKSFKGGFGFSGPGGTSAGAGAPPKSPPGTIGELKKDPVCGTFISTQTAFQKSVRGETYYFCSTECRDKFQG
jgi:YHS domain-containing protein